MFIDNICIFFLELDLKCCYWVYFLNVLWYIVYDVCVGENKILVKIFF